MGFILSKFRRKKSTQDVLEGLEKEIKRISQNKRQSLVSQSTVVRKILIYGLFFWVLASGCIFYLYRSAQSTEDYIIFVPILIFIPGLLFLFRKVLTWWYHSKINKDDAKLSKLQEEKSKILDEVMEKETYKVATQILEKYDPSRLAGKNSDSKGTVIGSGRPSPVPLVVSASSSRLGAGQPGQRPGQVSSPANMELRKRAVPPQQSMNRSLNQSMTMPPARKEGGPVNLNQTIASVGRSPVPPPQMGRGGMPPMGMGRGGPPLPRPIIPRERGIMDRMVEYLVGDGPSNRYALICRQCQSHNGMALREEFEFISYRCCYCHYWNPARKQRPIAPRLPVPPPSLPESPKPARSGRESEGVSESEKGSPNPRKSIDEKSDEKTDDESEAEKTEKDTGSSQLQQDADDLESKLQEDQEETEEDMAEVDQVHREDAGEVDDERDEDEVVVQEEANLETHTENTFQSQHIELINKELSDQNEPESTSDVENNESKFQLENVDSNTESRLENGDSVSLLTANVSSEQMEVDS